MGLSGKITAEAFSKCLQVVDSGKHTTGDDLAGEAGLQSRLTRADRKDLCRTWVVDGLVSKECMEGNTV